MICIFYCPWDHKTSFNCRHHRLWSKRVVKSSSKLLSATLNLFYCLVVAIKLLQRVVKCFLFGSFFLLRSISTDKTLDKIGKNVMKCEFCLFNFVWSDDIKIYPVANSGVNFTIAFYYQGVKLVHKRVKLILSK